MPPSLPSSRIVPGPSGGHPFNHDVVFCYFALSAIFRFVFTSATQSNGRCKYEWGGRSYRSCSWGGRAGLILWQNERVRAFPKGGWIFIWSHLFYVRIFFLSSGFSSATTSLGPPPYFIFYIETIDFFLRSLFYFMLVIQSLYSVCVCVCLRVVYVLCVHAF